MKLKLKLVERTHGASPTFKNKKIMKFDGCIDRYTLSINKQTGQLRTGLSKEDESKYEKALGLEERSLAPNINSDFWCDFTIPVLSTGTYIDTASDLGGLQYAVLKADPLVATTSEELKKSNVFQYTLIEERDEAESINNSRSAISRAWALYDKISADETKLKDVLYMYGHDPKSTEIEIVRKQVGDYVESNPKKFVSIMEDNSLQERVFLIKLIKKGVLTKNGIGSGYNAPLYYKDILLGTGLDEAIAFINEEENQKIFIALKKEAK